MKRDLNKMKQDCKESKDTVELKSILGAVKRKIKIL